MEKKDFVNFYNNVIGEYIKEIMAFDSENNFNCLSFHESNVLKVYDYYEYKRMEIRERFMNLKNRPMDRHKIAAVMMYAILKSRLITTNTLKVANLPDVILMANEYLAVYTALNIVEMYRNDDNNDATNNAKASGEIPLLKEVQIRIPAVYHGENREDPRSYLSNICKSLYLLRNPKYFDVFAYSNIMFLLERYTDDICEKEQEIAKIKHKKSQEA